MTKKEEIDQYRQDEGINQSFLKGILANDFRVKKTDSESIAMLRGSLTDCMILTPELLDDFYYLSELEKAPTPLIKKTMDLVFEQSGEWDTTAFVETYRMFSDAKTPTKEETILKNVDAAQNYWDELIKGTGKEVVTRDKWIHCQNAKMNLLTNPNTREHFENTLFYDIQYQVPIYDNVVVEGENVRRKGLLDFLIVDDHNMTVQIKDLKTSSALPDEWKYMARKFRIDFQMAYYYDIVSNMFPHHKQLLPELVVYSFAAPTKPFVKIVDVDTLFAGRNGFERIVATNIYERVEESATHDVVFHHGWETALQRYIQAKQLGLPDYDIEYFRNNGRSNLDLWT